MAQVTVTLESADTYAVEVSDASGTSRHVVTATPTQLAELGIDAAPERVLRESFEFLLEREPKESILGRFELPVIGHYFPEYRAEIRRRLAS